MTDDAAKARMKYSPDPGDYTPLGRIDYGQKCMACNSQGVEYRERPQEFNVRRGTSGLCSACYEALGEPSNTPALGGVTDETDPPEAEVQAPAQASTTPGPRPDVVVEQASISTIPEQLHGCRFVKVRRQDKTAFEAGWQTTANYAADDPRILAHLTAGGNYGVMPAGGVCVLDADKAGRLRDLGILDIFNGTYTVRTGRETGDGLHVYFRCTGAPSEKFLLKDPLTGEELGDLRGSGHASYCVGPGSVHPSGRKYVPVDETASLVEIPWDDVLKKIVRPLSPQKPEPKPGGQASATGANISDALGLRVTQFLMPVSPRRRGDEIEGGHPIHGSETGTNLTVNETKNVWWCRRHLTGGGPFEAAAVAEGIIDCADARPGCLEDHWPEVFAALERHGYGPQLRELERERNRNNRRARLEAKASTTPVVEKAESTAGAPQAATPRATSSSPNAVLDIRLPEGHIVPDLIEFWMNQAGGHPEFKYAQAISILSALAEGKIYMDLSFGRVYPNMWCLLLGLSSVSAKTSGINEFVEFIRYLQVPQLPISFSREGFGEALSLTPNAVYANDEIVGLLKGMHRQGSYLSGLSDDLCQYYDCPDVIVRRLAKGKNAEPRGYEIHNPYITFFGATTPKSFNDNALPEDFEGGLLARFLLFRNDRPAVYVDVGHSNSEAISTKSTLIRRLMDIQAAIRLYRRIELRLSDSAFAAYNAWQRKELERAAAAGEDAITISARLRVYTFKLAMLYFVGSPEFTETLNSEYESRPDIDKERMNLLPGENLKKIDRGVFNIPDEYFFEAMRHIQEYFTPMSEFCIAEAIRQNAKSTTNQIILTLEKAPGRTLTRSALMRNLPKSIPARELTEQLDMLEDDGIVARSFQETIDKLGRPRRREVVTLIADRGGEV